jgi:hypothetical protein
MHSDSPVTYPWPRAKSPEITWQETVWVLWGQMWDHHAEDQVWLAPPVYIYSTLHWLLHMQSVRNWYFMHVHQQCSIFVSLLHFLNMSLHNRGDMLEIQLDTYTADTTSVYRITGWVKCCPATQCHYHINHSGGSQHLLVIPTPVVLFGSFLHLLCLSLPKHQTVTMVTTWILVWKKSL